MNAQNKISAIVIDDEAECSIANGIYPLYK